MKLVQATRFGDPTVLVVTEVPDPGAGRDEIAIDVTHAAVGLVDVFFRQGLFKDVPGMAQPPFIPGLEVAGTVRSFGKDVTGFAIGEKVVSMSAGSGDQWLGNMTVSGFNAGAYLPTHPHVIRPALEAALTAVIAGLGQTEIDVLPFSEAALAHERMESRALNGRIVLTP